ncbi:hypothetical protein GCM10011512_16150 [Tersicoccus solisilvae]|uniref:D-inositol 3-phosphate glycosyltransferase n=1 Tax=Tersicoccus solisilvae TaxID=1882339 RepID=A0ABQ1P6P5_9MICC|nr:glycosyltransferase [Tersicoccus solisilvae]GGC89960.1 hypothetical protein GCM10011512_16150 [Tersicoccus solisilvae]
MSAGRRSLTLDRAIVLSAAAGALVLLVVLRAVIASTALLTVAAACVVLAAVALVIARRGVASWLRRNPAFQAVRAATRRGRATARSRAQVATDAVFDRADDGDPGWRTLMRRDVVRLAADRADSHPLAVYEMVAAADAFDAVSLTTLRTVARGLRARGYTVKSQHLLRLVLAKAPNDKLAAAVEQRDAEVAVFSGAFVPAVGEAHPRVDPRPGTVLHVVGKVLPITQSGYTLRTHYTALAQREAGLTVEVCNQSGESSPEAVGGVLERDGIRYHVSDEASRTALPLTAWLAANVDHLARVTAMVRPAVLHAHSDFSNALTARIVGDHFGIPVVYETRGFWEESWLSRMAQTTGIEDVEAFCARWGRPDTYRWRLEREDQYRRAADHVFTLADVMKRRIVDHGCAADRVTVVPNAVSGAQFPVQARNPALAQQLGIRAEETVVGYISSIVEYEGIPVLLRAFRQLRERADRPVRLLIVGDGPVLAAVTEEAVRLGIDDAIFTGRVPHDAVLDYYGMIDVFVVPRTPAEVCQLVTPLKPFEAFATGRAVVMSDVSALREIADASGSSALFRAGDSESLAEVLTRLVADEATRARMAVDGATWVREHRSWQANAAAYLREYRRLGEPVVTA